MDEFREKMEASLREIKEKEEKRYEYNIKCLLLLEKIILNKPYLRFGQILAKLKLDGDIFNEESIDTYERIKDIDIVSDKKQDNNK